MDVIVEANGVPNAGIDHAFGAIENHRHIGDYTVYGALRPSKQSVQGVELPDWRTICA